MTNVDFHPLKGPMTTQTLRGMQHGGPMHWRGDRSGGAISEPQPVLGRRPAERARREPGVLEVQSRVRRPARPAEPALPPRHAGVRDVHPAGAAAAEPDPQSRQLATPRRSRSARTSSTAADLGHAQELQRLSHALDQAGGFFGTGGLLDLRGRDAALQGPHLRNVYQKVGMFGKPAERQCPATGSPTTAQIRGFGSPARRQRRDGIALPERGGVQLPGRGDVQRTDVVELHLRVSVGLRPDRRTADHALGRRTRRSAVVPRVNLLVQRAGTPYADADRVANNECDLVVKGRVAGQPRGWWMSAPGMFTPDEDGAATLTDANLRLLAGSLGGDLTYTCVPPGLRPASGDRSRRRRRRLAARRDPRRVAVRRRLQRRRRHERGRVSSCGRGSRASATSRPRCKCNVRGPTGSSEEPATSPTCRRCAARSRGSRPRSRRAAHSRESQPRA